MSNSKEKNKIKRAREHFNQLRVQAKKRGEDILYPCYFSHMGQWYSVRGPVDYPKECEQPNKTNQQKETHDGIISETYRKPLTGAGETSGGINKVPLRSAGWEEHYASSRSDLAQRIDRSRETSNGARVGEHQEDGARPERLPDPRPSAQRISEADPRIGRATATAHIRGNKVTSVTIPSQGPHKEGEKLQVVPAGRSTKRSTLIEMAKAMNYLEQNRDKVQAALSVGQKLHDLAVELGVSESSASRLLDEMGFTRMKRTARSPRGADPRISALVIVIRRMCRELGISYSELEGY